MSKQVFMLLGFSGSLVVFKELVASGIADFFSILVEKYHFDCQ